MCAKCEELKRQMVDGKLAIQLMAADGRLVVTVGLEGLVKVHTDDVELLRGGAAALVEGLEGVSREAAAIDARMMQLNMALGAIVSRLEPGKVEHEAKPTSTPVLSFNQPAPKGGRKS